MRVITRISDLKAVIRMQKKSGKTIGLVPTMGYLHEGHLSLARASKNETDFTLMSVFVNPTQFGPNEDLDRYPRDFEGDVRKADSIGVDVVFAPEVSEMYPEGYGTYVEVNGITETMCGKSRPGHFKGVTTVVTKLFNLVSPDKAYFGQKDAQQAAVIKKMAKELNMEVEVIVCPIIREQDGLALSSRNVYLNSEERKAALILSKSLFKAREMIKAGERSCDKVRKYLVEAIHSEEIAELDYAEVLDADTLENVILLQGRVLLALAVRFGKTRLIDNVIVEV